jgi:hypothetical protein
LHFAIIMNGRKTEQTWWQEITRSERFNSAEWLLLGVSGSALTAALMVLLRALG